MIEQFTFQLCVLERYIINFNIDKFYYFIIYFINNILHENSVSCLRNNIII